MGLIRQVAFGNGGNEVLRQDSLNCKEELTQANLSRKDEFMILDCTIGYDIGYTIIGCVLQLEDKNTAGLLE